MPACFDKLEYGGRIVDCVIYEVTLGEWRYDYGRDSCARAPTIDPGGRNVIPYAPVLGVRDDDHRIIPDEAIPNGPNNHVGITVPASEISVARMFIVLADRFVETHGRKRAVVYSPHHIPLVLQVFGAP